MGGGKGPSNAMRDKVQNINGVVTTDPVTAAMDMMNGEHEVSTTQTEDRVHMAVDSKKLTAVTRVRDLVPPEMTAQQRVEESLTEGEKRIRALLIQRKSDQKRAAKTSADLKTGRNQLDRELHVYKSTLVRVGRGGGWAKFVKSLGMSLTTADRYVERHKAQLSGAAKGNLVSDEISDEQIAKLVKSCSRSLTKKLHKPEHTQKFLAMLTTAMQLDASPSTAGADSTNRSLSDSPP